MGVSTKGEGQYMWISGTPEVMGQIESMMHGSHTRVGVEACITPPPLWYDRSPVTRGRSVAKYPLLHGPVV